MSTQTDPDSAASFQLGTGRMDCSSDPALRGESSPGGSSQEGSLEPALAGQAVWAS